MHLLWSIHRAEMIIIHVLDHRFDGSYPWLVSARKQGDPYRAEGKATLVFHL